jgi:hypothetical protein
MKSSAAISTATKLSFAALHTGLSIYGGGALAPILSTLAGTGMVDILKDFAASWISDSFSVRKESADKDSRAHHDIAYGINFAASLCLDIAVTQTEKPSWKQYLSRFATDLRSGALTLRVENPAAPVTVDDMPGIFVEQQSLSPGEWKDFLMIYAPEVNSSRFTLLELNNHDREDILEFASNIFISSFSEQLRVAYRTLGAANDPAWANLLLHLISEIRLDVTKTGREIQSVNGQLDDIKKSIGQLVKKLHDGLEDVFKLPAAASLSNLPFLYTKRETHIQGDVARNMLGRDLADFFDDDRKLCWWLWTGLEGAGKSRLALEACDYAQSLHWKAGFVDYEKLKFKDTLKFYDRWRTCLIEGNFLLVFDYAGFAPELLRSVITELASRADRDPDEQWRIRILLLERNVKPISPSDDVMSLPQWCVELFGYRANHSGPEALLRIQYPSRGHSSFHLGELTVPSAYALADEYLDQLDQKGRYSTSTRQPLSQEKKEEIVAETLKLCTKTRRPLHIMITARVLRDIEDGDFTSFDQVILKWLENRVPLRQDALYQSYNSKKVADQLLNLLCVATVLGELRLDDIPEHELLPDRRLVMHDRTFLGIFEQDWRSESLRKLEPDLIGEWYVLFRTEVQKPHSGLTPSVLSEIVDKFEGAKPGLKEFVRHTYRSFHDLRLDHERKSALWKVLRGTLGRYATRFGEVFDKKPVELVRGTAHEAEDFYSALVFKKIEEAIRLRPKRKPVIVDLMAGGSARPVSLLKYFGSRIILIAVDRDDSRLHAIHPPKDAYFRLEKIHINETFSLTPMLAKVGRTGCDLVIAKKALHELPWSTQQTVIANIGSCLNPGGSVVLYADSPAMMDQDTMDGWLSEEIKLRELLPMDGGDDSEIARRVLFPENLNFDPLDPSSAAVFINHWIKLKDWANYNISEYSNRFFSSANQIEGEFAKAGLPVDGTPQVYFMELLPQRFIEEAINRLDYLCVDRTLRADDLLSLVHQNHRYSLFWDFAEAHLWNDGAPTAFGGSVHAKRENSGLESLVQEEFEKEYGHFSLPDLSGPSFRMPIHVFSFRKPLSPAQ